MRKTIRIFLLTLSGIVFAIGIIWGVAGFMKWIGLIPAGGDFISGTGLILSLLAVGVGTVLSFLLNLTAWGLGSRSRWLKWTMIAQSPFALLIVSVPITLLWLKIQENRAFEQSVAIHEAIYSDDPAAFDAARARCEEPCQENEDLSADLTIAAEEGAIRVAQHLVASGVRMIGNRPFTSPSRHLYTCEGSILSFLSGLSVAVASDNRAMVELLLPVSDQEEKKKEALLTAAELDRMAMIQLFLAANLPLPTASAGNESRWNSLLVAAAGGAALEVGQWLLSERPVPISQDEIQKALQELFLFTRDKATHRPRALPFAKLLIAHGADVNAPFNGKPTFLHEALRAQNGRMARLLISAGADPLRLSREERKKLNSLLAAPDDGVALDAGRKGCVAP